MHSKFLYAGLVIVLLIVILSIVKWVLSDNENFQDENENDTTINITTTASNDMNTASNDMDITINNTNRPTLPIATEIPTKPNTPTLKLAGSLPTEKSMLFSMPDMDIPTATSNYTIPIVKPPSATIQQSSSETTMPQIPINNTELYTKFGETLIDESSLNIDTLYNGYKGNNKGDKVWTNVNLDQCYELCNQMDGCVGFSRPLNVADNDGKSANSYCYPRTSINMCHSARKGNQEQRTNAIKYNTFLKNTTRNMRTRCIGDPKLTLGQPVVFKSALYPSQYLAVSNNEVVLMEIPKNSDLMTDFYTASRFEFIIGLDGSGTVAIKHIATNKVLYRNGDVVNSTVEAIDNSTITTTEQKQRASYYLDDGNVSGNVRLKCYLVGGESIPKFITINPDNTTRLIVSEKHDSSEQDFEILDLINDMPVSNMETVSSEKAQFADVGEEQINLDKIKTLLSGTKTSDDFKTFMEEKYPVNYRSNVDKEYPEITSSSSTINLNQLKQFNMTSESKLYDENAKINAGYQNIYAKLNKMYLDDYLNDYYYLKQLVKK